MLIWDQRVAPKLMSNLSNAFIQNGFTTKYHEVIFFDFPA